MASDVSTSHDAVVSPLADLLVVTFVALVLATGAAYVLLP